MFFSAKLTVGDIFNVGYLLFVFFFIDLDLLILDQYAIINCRNISVSFIEIKDVCFGFVCVSILMEREHLIHILCVIIL